MATIKKTPKRSSKKNVAPLGKICNQPPEKRRLIDPSIHPSRERLIIRSGKKWVAGTVLHYFFFKAPVKWKGTSKQLALVRKAFKEWKRLGIGLEFKEVKTPEEAEIRIGFQQGDGHWSFLGRDILDFGPSERTMNLDKGDGWGIDTALHEIGHTLGFPHEHQNPKAGIVWDEDKVYESLAKSPNFWDKETTHHNIIRKLNLSEVEGSTWDPDSIMHYPFEAGLIRKPVKYQTIDLIPTGGLTKKDKEMVKLFYPPIYKNDHIELIPLESVPFELSPGEQINFSFVPDETRKYSFQTFGKSDTVMALFEQINSEPRFVAGDDDGGEDRNSSFRVKLFSGRQYFLRLRLYWSHSKGRTAVMAC